MIDSLNQHNLKWHLAFSNPSYASKMAPVRAGIGITAIRRSMIPNYLDRLLSSLTDIHVSLIKKEGANKAIESLEFFIMDKLKY